MSEKEIIKQSSPAELIQSAISSGTDLDKLEKLLELQERWEAKEARKAYNKALSLFKTDPPKIIKDKKVGYSTSKGKVGYSYASLAHIVEKITPALSKFGLSANWITTQKESSITVTCRLTHEDGHSETVSITAPEDSSGSKSVIQSVGSTISYLSRYSLLCITGLAADDMDTDGIVPEENIDSNKIKILKDLISEIKVNKEKFLKYMNTEKIEDIKACDFAKGKLALEQKRRKKDD